MSKLLENKHEPNIFNSANEIQAQIIRGLRYFIVLNILKTRPMHGYGIITVIRKNFGLYLGPSSVYPLLNDIENWKYLESTWETDNLHPKRVYELTNKGLNLLKYMERSFGPTLRGAGVSEDAKN